MDKIFCQTLLLFFPLLFFSLFRNIPCSSETSEVKKKKSCRNFAQGLKAFDGLSFTATAITAQFDFTHLFHLTLTCTHYHNCSASSVWGNEGRDTPKRDSFPSKHGYHRSAGKYTGGLQLFPQGAGSGAWHSSAHESNSATCRTELVLRTLNLLLLTPAGSQDAADAMSLSHGLLQDKGCVTA